MSELSPWDLGSYARIAEQLRPAARALVEHAAVRPGERLLDIGCGTGSAALVAAEHGARVTGVDPAERLLDRARDEAGARRLDVRFLAGEAQALPMAGGSIDVAVSAFGVIFAPDARAAAAEIVRVLDGNGRAAISAWLPHGPLAAVSRLRAEALAAASGAAPGAAPFAWHSADALNGLLARHGFCASVSTHSLHFHAQTAGAFLDGELRDHPLWVAARATLEPRGELEAVRSAALSILEEANEESRWFRITSDYVIAAVSRLPR